MNIDDDPNMAQFKLKTWEANTTVTSHTNRKIESGYRTDSIAYIRCKRSCKLAFPCIAEPFLLLPCRFYFERQSGFFMLQVFFPLFLILCCFKKSRGGLPRRHTSSVSKHKLVSKTSAPLP